MSTAKMARHCIPTSLKDGVRALTELADKADAEGNRTMCIEIIDQIYQLLDCEYSEQLINIFSHFH